MKLTPKARRNLFRIFPFGFIWLFVGWFFLLSDTLLTGNQNPDPTSAVTISVPIFLFSSLAIMLVGFLVGTIELFLMEKWFHRFSFVWKVFYKFLVYSTLMLIIMVLAFPLAAAIELSKSIIDPEVLEKTANFFHSTVFWNTALQLSFHIMISVFYAAISENLGHQVTINFITGRYHRPKQEYRIFMFLDMKNSTGIAEKIGHVRYFDLLQLYYEIMSDAIIRSKGEVYQYIGDEVVISWLAKDGFENNRCIQCFFDLKKVFREKADDFQRQFGVIPDFKAGAHVGEVTTGEIGALKKQIVYTGDVLNTTARIQSLCKQYESDLLTSQKLTLGLHLPEEVKSDQIGEILLRGKQKKVILHAISTNQ
ncbi:adenylate/guanylate cyclase domain-containing protein [bacterium SCSIO 12741]|nr:adenylate/guanylate cyclase domain-containing protein [bacterium SCSIO 12741]